MTEQTSQKRKFHILAVEDEAPNLHLIAASLQNQYKVSVAKTLEKARGILQQQSIDILLLDINLPDGSGLDLCQEVISQTEVFGDVRIIFMTGLTSADDEVKGLNLGAADYIHKPLNSAVLQARVRLQAQLIRRTELLAKLARVDGLTEIPNRRAFEAQLKNEWFRAKREQCSLVLAIVDIDHFKLFNDHYGHPTGDKCLHDFAQFLSRFFKRGSDFVARYGGEEFAILLSAIDLDVAMVLFERAQEEVQELAMEHSTSPVKPIVTFSAGLCFARPEVDDPQKFVTEADKQLYLAKAEGRAQSKGTSLNR